MRVMQIMAGAPFGGAEAFYQRLVIALHKAGLEQKAVIRTNQARAALLRDEGVDVVELPFGGMLDLRTPWNLKSLMKSYQPQVAMTWMNRATKMTPPAAKTGGQHTLVARLGGYYDLKYYKHCDHLIGNTQDIVDYLVREGWPEDRAHHLPNFVTPEASEGVPRASLHVPDKAQLILAMGRLHENKAFDVLLDSLVAVPNAYLVLAGEGPLREVLEKQAEKIGVRARVRFLGWRDDTAALLKACDVFVCPSRHEPLGNVVLEAWAQGVPVVAADSLGPGILIEHQINGLLVPIDDAVQMSHALQAVLGDPIMARGLAEAGHAAYLDGFTEQAIVEQYLAFFQKVGV